MSGVPARGRPRDPAKRAAIVAAGRALFVRTGTGPVTVEQVLQHAGVSRVTFYANFADMDALLEAVVEVESERITQGAGFGVEDEGGLATALRRFGVNLLSFLSDPAMMAFERLLTAEIQARHDLARRFFEAGPKRAHDRLVGIVTEGIARGELRVTDPTEAVGDLIGLWQGFERLEHAFGVIETPSPARIEARVDRCVAMFMRLHARPRRAARQGPRAS